MATDAKTGQPIYHGAPRVGLRNVGSYQVSGEPWVSGSSQAAGKCKRYVFPFVTREVTVALEAASSATSQVWVHFASGSGHNDFVDDGLDIMNHQHASDVFIGRHHVPITSGSQSVTFRAKCKEIYVTTPNHNTAAVPYNVLADLTNIPTSRMYHLTGSGSTERSLT